MSTIKPITALKHRLSKRRRKGSPVTEKWFRSVCFGLGLCPDKAKLSCANKGWLARISNKRFFPACNLVGE
jgi:hypothetical protein